MPSIHSLFNHIEQNHDERIFFKYINHYLCDGDKRSILNFYMILPREAYDIAINKFFNTSFKTAEKIIAKLEQDLNQTRIKKLDQVDKLKHRHQRSTVDVQYDKNVILERSLGLREQRLEKTLEVLRNLMTKNKTPAEYYQAKSFKK